MAIQSTLAAMSLPDPHASFEASKQRILAQLAVPAEEYDDLSPKGSVDAPIRALIDRLNSAPGFVTTSSCSGRVSVFVEGNKKRATVLPSGIVIAENDPAAEMLAGSLGLIEMPDPMPTVADIAAAARARALEAASEDAVLAESHVGRPDPSGELAALKPPAETLAGAGGKGGGGTWLYVNHSQFTAQELGNDLAELVKGWSEDGFDVAFGQGSLIHFKYEPFILHVLTASPEHAQLLIQAATAAGFPETCAVNLLGDSNMPAKPMVAIRSAGMAFESLLGSQNRSGRRTLMANMFGINAMADIAVKRFAENEKRRDRFENMFFHMLEVVGHK
jgi:tRNA wybutosine-synthesizing protein 3